MLYSELKERENRFIISLEIAFPFLVLALLLFYIFKISTNDIEIKIDFSLIDSDYDESVKKYNKKIIVIDRHKL